MRFLNFLKTQKGQMLIEILVAVVIAGIVIGGVATIIGTSLVTGKKTKQVTVANGLAQQDMEAIKTLAQSSWIKLYCPPTGTCPGNKGVTSTYNVILSGGSWVFQSGVATTTVDSLGFGHYFYVENVERDSGGDIVASGGDEDPSTQKVTVYIVWSGGSEFSVSEYVMRTGSALFIDRGWVSGNLNDGPYTRSAGAYSTSSASLLIQNQSLQASGDTGILTSSIFDTGATNGVAFNNILWKGTQATSSYVLFQFASSNSTSSFNFIGPDGTSATYYQPDFPNISSIISTRYHNNHRYFRYKVYIYLNPSSQSPQITDIIIGYSP